jgi:hypothetical protein
MFIKTLALAAAVGISLASQAHAVLPASEECRNGQADVLLSSIEQQTAMMTWKMKVGPSGPTDEDRTQKRKQLDAFSDRMDADLQKCKRGDMLSLPSSETRLVGEKCDFDKTIYRESDQVLCVSR